MTNSEPWVADPFPAKCQSHQDKKLSGDHETDVTDMQRNDEVGQERVEHHDHPETKSRPPYQDTIRRRFIPFSTLTIRRRRVRSGGTELPASYNGWYVRLPF